MIGEILLIGIAIAITVAACNQGRPHTRAALSRWSAVAERLGLQDSSSWFGPAFQLSGWLDGVRIEVKPYESGGISGRLTVLVTADPPQPISHIFMLTPKRRRFATIVSEVLSSAERKTGDHEFDSTFYIEGTEIETLAGLSLPVRKALLRLAAAGTPAVESGALHLWLSATQFDKDEIAEILLALAHTANGLSLGGRQQSLQQLAASARTDPVSGVRHRCLQALLESAGGSPFCTATVQAALEDSNPEVRYLAAIQPHAEGLAVLRQLVMSASSPEDVRAKALRRLARRLSDSEMVPCLEMLLTSTSVKLRHAAFEVAEHVNHRPLAARLLSLLDPNDLAGAERIARAVGNIGGPEHEPELLKVLDWRAEAVQIEAARALGRVGTIRAVEKLLQHSQPKLLERSTLSLVARLAMQEIQSRAAAASAGQLSIADAAPDTGALSFPAETGTLTITPADPDSRKPPSIQEPTGEPD